MKIQNILKKKKKILILFGKKDFLVKTNVLVLKFKHFLNDNKISEIDLLKIDTEGYEFDVIKGLEEKIKIIKIIHFEHHYDDMIIKNYKFRDINDILISNNFKQVFKIKMFFTKHKILTK